MNTAKKKLPEYQTQPPEVFHKKGVLKTFPKFTGKYLFYLRTTAPEYVTFRNVKVTILVPHSFFTFLMMLVVLQEGYENKHACLMTDKPL